MAKCVGLCSGESGAPSERGATGGRLSATASRASRGRSPERHDGGGSAWLDGEQSDQTSVWSLRRGHLVTLTRTLWHAFSAMSLDTMATVAITAEDGLLLLTDLKDHKSEGGL